MTRSFHEARSMISIPHTRCLSHILLVACSLTSTSSRLRSMPSLKNRCLELPAAFLAYKRFCGTPTILARVQSTAFHAQLNGRPSSQKRPRVLSWPPVSATNLPRPPALTNGSSLFSTAVSSRVRLYRVTFLKVLCVTVAQRRMLSLRRFHDSLLKACMRIGYEAFIHAPTGAGSTQNVLKLGVMTRIGELGSNVITGLQNGSRGHRGNLWSSLLSGVGLTLSLTPPSQQMHKPVTIQYASAPVLKRFEEVFDEFCDFSFGRLVPDIYVGL